MARFQFRLTDDGTMDTLVRCVKCGQVDRYNYDPQIPDPNHSDQDEYDAFVDECIVTSEEDHVCPKKAK